MERFPTHQSARLGYYLRRLLRRPLAEPDEVAIAREVLSPEETRPHTPPRMVRGHLERIKSGWDGEDAGVLIQRMFSAERQHAATVAYTLQDVVLVGPRLLSGRAYVDLCRGNSPGLREVADFDEVTLASCWTGARWFGHCIHDEFPLQLLAAELGNPVAHARPPYRDEPAYRDVFGIPAPRTTPGFYARRCRVIQDFAQNASKRARYAQMRANVARVNAPSVRVYIQRDGGERRQLKDEERLMESLASRGFVILNNGRDSVAHIADVCSRAEQIVTVDGSHAAPALLLAPHGAELVVISPPDRVTDIMLEIGEA